jgi:hypothetical protein
VREGGLQVGPGTQWQVATSADRRARAAQFKPELKANPNSNGSKHFQIVSNFDRLEKYFPVLRKIEIKFGFEALEEGNNFISRNFLKFRIDFDLKFREASMS